MGDRPTSAGIYCRLSYADDGTEEKVDRQEHDCRQLADRLAWPISEQHVWKDNNRSAWQRTRKRPGWDAMLAAIDAGEIDAVIVYHGDRLIRQSWDLELLLRVASEKRVRLASVAGTRDLSNPDDQYILRIEAAGFCRESESTSRRVRRAQEKRTEARLPRPGGTRAFGFERDNVTIKRAEADILVEAADRLLAGQTMYAVHKWVNSVCTTTPGNRWRVNVLKDMLRRPRIAGLMEHGGELVKAAWEPILPVETWQDMCAVLDKTRSDYLASNDGLSHDYAVRYLLTGIARCGTCGGPMRAQASWRAGGEPRRTYLCGDSGCPYQVGRDMKHLDTYVVGRALGVLNDPEFVASLYADMEQPGLAAEISRLEERRASTKRQLENLADEGIDVDPVTLARSLASFDEKISALRDRRARTRRQRLLARMAGTTWEQWEAEPLDVRRATISALFAIEVLPAVRKGSGFDPSRVRIALVDG